MFGRARSILGLDIGTSSVKAVELSQEGEAYTITGYGQVDAKTDVPPRDILKELLSAFGIRARRVVTAVSGRSVIVRYVSMVEMSDEDLQNAIKFEADKYIPFEVDEVVLDCQRLEDVPSAPKEGAEQAEMKVLLVAVKRSVVDDHVQLLHDTGLTPEVIDVDSFALGNAFEFRDLLSPRVEEKEKVVALIDIGANKTNINIKKGRTTYFTREIYLAGNDFTDAISKRLGLEVAEAETLKREPGERIGELMEAVSPTIEDLGNEIHLSFDYYENQYDSEVEEVFLSGGGARFPQLEETFSRIFDRKTSTWDPTENLEVGARVDAGLLKQNASQLAIAMGLAARLRKE
ncbi:MAG: pilus assembly protein PilM [Planctomycetales bacterium]|nr:pilus assembly protein PilM [Planctomycetales bacterium]